ncbi:hypothetical protein HanPI659440_Chr15g0612941 [Helianthus annuus]|nr:hypothetical protein HanPI659440_Chr15g0612941 [Helianthus annuus]
MVPLLGNRMVPTTRNLADQLATIAAQLDAILASLRDNVDDIKAKMIGDGCNSKESDSDLKNKMLGTPFWSSNQMEPEDDPHGPLPLQVKEDTGENSMPGVEETFPKIFLLKYMEKNLPKNPGANNPNHVFNPSTKTMCHQRCNFQREKKVGLV